MGAREVFALPWQVSVMQSPGSLVLIRDSLSGDTVTVRRNRTRRDLLSTERPGEMQILQELAAPHEPHEGRAEIS